MSVNDDTTAAQAERSSARYSGISAVEVDVSPGLSYARALYVFLRGMIVIGVLSLPLAMFYAGIWTGIALLLAVIVVNLECLHMLVRSSKHFETKLGVSNLQYADVAECALKYGPERLRRGAKAARYLVILATFCTKLGFCSVELVFIAANIKQVTESYLQTTTSHGVYIALLFLPEIVVLCFSRKIKILALLAFLGSIVHFIAIGIIYGYLLQALRPIDTLPAFNSWSALPLFFGTAIYALQGIFWVMVLPVRKLMRDNTGFDKWNGVLNTTFLVAGGLYLSFAILGYLQFGDAIAQQASITLNLPKEERLYQAVMSMFACSVFITYAIEMYIPNSIVSQFVRERYGDQEISVGRSRRSLSKATLLELAATLFMVLLTSETKIPRIEILLPFLVGLAALIPHLELFMALVGCIAGSAQTFFPPLIEILTLKSSKSDDTDPPGWGRWNWILLKNVLVCLFGFLGFTSGIYTSLKRIIERF